ncbi:MAG TPA: hypothetical protein VJ692_05915, partial [Nitrospiraceae bacterium]|nr:hypothetical protein [Nitrospiraceae bacterium]
MSTWTDLVTEAFERGRRDQAVRYLTAQRWFGAKGRRLTGIRVIDHAGRADTPDAPLLTILGVEFADGPPERYFLPLAVRPERESTAPHEAKPIMTIQAQGQSVTVQEITTDSAACLALLESIRQEDRWHGAAGVFTCTQTPAFESFASVPFENVKAIGAEQSNTSLIYDSRAILKLIRKLEGGVNPDGEILEFLTTKTSYRNVPALLGQIRYESRNEAVSGSAYSATVAILTAFIPNEGDGWTMALRHLERLLSDSRSHGDSITRSQAAARVQTHSDEFLSRMRRLG